ncbi:MAG: HAMP domain-containing histidine kinase, partial [Chloroflexi bacterium]|nr:HAMP domain-containing histidine kinase [Chloroflexota bacterium]
MSSGLWVRAFAGLVVAILPPLIALAALLLGWPAFNGFDPFATGIGIVGGAIAWAAVLAVIYARSLGDEFRELVALARGGTATGGAEPGVAQQQLANLLDERNRQVATLAQQAGSAPIGDDPVRVVRSVITAVESVMGDATWRGAVLASDDASILAPGVYDSGEGVPVQPLTDLERWAAATDPAVPVRHVAGPLGAFTVVDAAVSGGNRVILYAPWEGRVAPTAAERDLLRLVGQHAGTSIDHALLYARVRSQADELNRMAAVQSDFLRGVTHDLQTPLTSIGAVAAELRADPSMPAAARADLDTVSHQADRLRRMVAQLLVASRLEAGAFTPQTDVFAVRPLIERTWAALRADRPFELTESGSPHLAVADPDRLEQVLWAVL